MAKQITELYPKLPSPCNCMNIHRASRAVVKFYDHHIRPSGLTIAQLGLMRSAEEGPVTISELARRLRIDRTTLNRNLKPLAAAGQLVIVPGTDPRTKQVLLTEQGRQSMQTAGELWGEAQEMLKQYLGKDLEKFTELMARLEALAP